MNDCCSKPSGVAPKVIIKIDPARAEAECTRLTGEALVGDEFLEAEHPGDFDGADGYRYRPDLSGPELRAIAGYGGPDDFDAEVPAGE